MVFQIDIPKKNKGIMWIALAGSCCLMALNLSRNTLPGFYLWTILAILILLYLFCVAKTVYSLTDTGLVIHNWLYHKEIPYRRMQALRREGSTFSVVALGNRQLTLYLEQGEKIGICPQEPELFCKELQKRARKWL